MTSQEMLREFKIGIDKIDSESYPEIYPEQIFMFINKAIDDLVNEGRVLFEKDQVVTDNLKSLIPRDPVIINAVRIGASNRYSFNLTGIDYLFYISSEVEVKKGDRIGIGFVNVIQHDDIKKILNDPHNSPRPSEVPITFSRNTIIGYTTSDFILKSLSLTYVKKPVKVSASVNCDLDEQIHYMIIDRAIQIAYQALGLNIKQEQ